MNEFPAMFQDHVKLGPIQTCPVTLFPFGSKANGRIAAIASRMSDARTEREIWLWINDHNRSIDENRGFAKPDFLRNYWEEEKLALLAGNLVGPVPGGNLMVPPEVRCLVCNLLARVNRFALFACCQLSLYEFEDAIG